MIDGHSDAYWEPPDEPECDCEDDEHCGICCDCEDHEDEPDMEDE